jgi:hypothetical protein
MAELIVPLPQAARSIFDAAYLQSVIPKRR